MTVLPLIHLSVLEISENIPFGVVPANIPFGVVPANILAALTHFGRYERHRFAFLFVFRGGAGASLFYRFCFVVHICLFTFRSIASSEFFPSEADRRMGGVGTQTNR